MKMVWFIVDPQIDGEPILLSVSVSLTSFFQM